MRRKIDNKDYKYYVFNLRRGKIISGWEYKEDAQERKNEMDLKQLKVYTRVYLNRIGKDPRTNKNWEDRVLGTTYNKGEEHMLYGFRKNLQIPEIRLRYNKGKTFRQITSVTAAYEFLKKVYGRSIGIQEQIIILYMDNSHNVLGYYKHTIGTPVSSVVDIPMLLAIALKSLSRAIIISHNHPSGTRRPSAADNKLTKDLKKAAKLMNINVLDHIILAHKNGYYSYTEEGNSNLAGFESKGNDSTEIKLRKEIHKQLRKVTQKNAPGIAALISTQKGYAEIENRIIKMVAKDGITPSACIPHIESEL